MPLTRGAAANAGLLATSGELLAFLDDDDTLDPDHFSSLVQLIQDHAPTCVVAYSGVRATQRQGDRSAILHEFVQAEFNPYKLLLGNFLPIHAPLFPKALLANGVVFDELLELYEDWDFWVQLSELVPFIYSGRITATYFTGGRSGVSPLAPDYQVTHSASLKFFEKWSHRITEKKLSGVSNLYLKLESAYSDSLLMLKNSINKNNEMEVALNEIGCRFDAHVNCMSKTEEKRIVHEKLIAEELNRREEDHVQLVTRLEQERAQFEQEVNHLQHMLTIAQRDIQIHRISTSWRLTKPIRYVGRQILRAKIIIKAFSLCCFDMWWLSGTNEAGMAYL